MSSTIVASADTKTEAPEASKKVETPQPDVADAKPETDAAPKKVLVVEDTVELGEVIQATLEQMGITVYHETHGNKAIEIYKSNKPDLVLLDIGLPDMIGWKMLDTVKDEEHTAPVVVISAYGDPANRLMGKLQDVDSYLIKPFTPDEVERVVRKVLGIETAKEAEETKKEDAKPETAPEDAVSTGDAKEEAVTDTDATKKKTVTKTTEDAEAETEESAKSGAEADEKSDDEKESGKSGAQADE